MTGICIHKWCIKDGAMPEATLITDEFGKSTGIGGIGIDIYCQLQWLDCISCPILAKKFFFEKLMTIEQALVTTHDKRWIAIESWIDSFKVIRVRN